MFVRILHDEPHSADCSTQTSGFKARAVLLPDVVEPNAPNSPSLGGMGDQPPFQSILWRSREHT